MENAHAKQKAGGYDSWELHSKTWLDKSKLINLHDSVRDLTLRVGSSNPITVDSGQGQRTLRPAHRLWVAQWSDTNPEQIAASIMTDLRWHIVKKSSQAVEHCLGIRRFRIRSYLQKFHISGCSGTRQVLLHGLNSQDARIASLSLTIWR